MKRPWIFVATIAALLALSGGVAVAEAGAETNGTTKETQAAEARFQQLMTEGALDRVGASERSLSTASAQPDWIFGPGSNTYYQDPFTFLILPYTMDFVGYWGTEDVSYPRVGDLYYGRVVVGNVASIEAIPIVDVKLPPHTTFDVNTSDQNRKVRCYLWDFLNDSDATNLRELTGSSCPAQPEPGIHGWNLNAASPWIVEPGYALIVDFPIHSSQPLVGIAGPHCLVAAIMVGFFDDVPPAGATCPLADNDGAYQGVFVAPRSGSGGGDTVPPTLTVLAAAKQKLGAALKTGVKSKATVNEPATIRTQLRLPAKLARKLKLNVIVGKATRTVSEASTIRIATKFTRKAKRKLSKLSSFKVVLRTIALDAAANKTVVNRTITLRR